ncbi:MAG: hypothetical protein HY816_01125 [Candidatus Wallbacteria bacterium]|nr:hypothetical protein [Candidatus Wallbacteria bacterium]
MSRLQRPPRSPALLVLTAWTLFATGAHAFMPAWEQGMTWTVSTVYRRAQLGRPEPGEPAPKAEWSPPTNWVFLVSKVENRKDGRYYLVQVKDREHKSSALASLVFASYKLSDGDESLALLRGKFLRIVRDKRVVTDAELNEIGQAPRPVLHEQSLIPYDFPSLPLVGPKAKERSRTFEVTIDAGGMQFAKDIVQKEETGLDPERIAGDEIRKRSGFPSTPRERMVFVTLSREMDGALCRQIWVPGLPWPLFVESGDSRSVLIFHSGEAREK